MESKFHISKKNQELIDVLKVKMRLLVKEFELSYDSDNDRGYMLRLSYKTDSSRLADSLFSVITLSKTPWNWQFNIGLNTALEDMSEKIDKKLNPKPTKFIL